MVQIAFDGEVLGNHQLRVEVDRHACGAERDSIARHCTAQGRAQRADATVGAVGHGDRRQAVLITRHPLVRQRRVALDRAGGNLQCPVAARASAVAGGGNIAPGQAGQRVDKADAFVALGGVAGINQDIAAGVHVLADLRQYRAAGRDVIGRQVGAAQPQIARITVGDDLHRTHALVAAQVVGDLLQAVFAGVQLHHLGAGSDAFEQVGGVFDARIDKHHGLPWHGHGRRRSGRFGLCMGVFAGGGMLGRRRLGRRVGGGMAVGLGRIGHGGGDRAVKQHARFEEHDHGCRQGFSAWCCVTCLSFAPPHAAHP